MSPKKSYTPADRWAVLWGRWIGSLFRRSRTAAARSIPPRPKGFLVEVLEQREVPAVNLLGEWCVASDAAQWGQTINISGQVRNNGSTASGPFAIAFYASKTAVGSTSTSTSIPLYHSTGVAAYNHVSGIGGNGVGTYFNITRKLPAMPSGWTGNSFFIVMKTDSASQIVESNEGDNFGQVGTTYDRDPITITAPAGNDTASPTFVGATLHGFTSGTPFTVTQGQTLNFGGSVTDNVALKQFTIKVSGPVVTNHTLNTVTLSGTSHSLGGYSFNTGSTTYANVPGTYWVTAFAADAANNPTTSKQWSFTVASSTPGDAYENDDTFQAAKAITLGVATTHTIHHKADTDWSKFALAGSTHTVLETRGVGTLNGDTVMHLYRQNASGQLDFLASSDNEGNGNFSQIVRTGSNVLTAGTYYVSVTSAGYATTILGGYTVKVAATPNLGGAAYTTDNTFWNDNRGPKSIGLPNSALGDALGNCTWYSVGRAREYGATTAQLATFHKQYANDFDDRATSSGLTVTATPTVGAIGQWDNWALGADGKRLSGHVAVVEFVHKNAAGVVTGIDISESSFAGSSPDVGNVSDFLYRTRNVSPSFFEDYISFGTPPPPPPPPPPPTTGGSVLFNGGFENGTANWVVTAGGQFPVLVADAATGAKALQLGDGAGGLGGGNTAAVSQNISIPANAVAPVLSLKYKIVGNDGTGNWDHMKVTIGGSEYLTAFADTGGWKTWTYDLSMWKGQTNVPVKVLSWTGDNEYPVLYYVDNLTVSAANSGFETGNLNGWAVTQGGQFPAVVAGGASGQSAVRLGDGGGGLGGSQTAAIQQSVAVPANSVAPALVLNYKVEGTDGEAWDWMRLHINGVQVKSWYAESGGWQNFTHPLDAYKGTNPTVKLSSWTYDAINPVNYFVDDFTIVV